MPDLNDFYAFKNTCGGSGSGTDFSGLKILAIVILVSVIFGILETIWS